MWWCDAPLRACQYSPRVVTQPVADPPFPSPRGADPLSIPFSSTNTSTVPRSIVPTSVGPHQQQQQRSSSALRHQPRSSATVTYHGGPPSMFSLQENIMTHLSTIGTGVSPPRTSHTEPTGVSTIGALSHRQPTVHTAVSRKDSKDRSRSPPIFTDDTWTPTRDDQKSPSSERKRKIVHGRGVQSRHSRSDREPHAAEARISWRRESEGAIANLESRATHATERVPRDEQKATLSRRHRMTRGSSSSAVIPAATPTSRSSSQNHNGAMQADRSEQRRRSRQVQRELLQEQRARHSRDEQQQEQHAPAQQQREQQQQQLQQKAQEQQWLEEDHRRWRERAQQQWDRGKLGHNGEQQQGGQHLERQRPEMQYKEPQQQQVVRRQRDHRDVEDKVLRQQLRLQQHPFVPQQQDEEQRQQRQRLVKQEQQQLQKQEYREWRKRQQKLELEQRQQLRWQQEELQRRQDLLDQQHQQLEQQRWQYLQQQELERQGTQQHEEKPRQQKQQQLEHRHALQKQQQPSPISSAPHGKLTALPIPSRSHPSSRSSIQLSASPARVPRRHSDTVSPLLHAGDVGHSAYPASGRECNVDGIVLAVTETASTSTRPSLPDQYLALPPARSQHLALPPATSQRHPVVPAEPPVGIAAPNTSFPLTSGDTANVTTQSIMSSAESPHPVHERMTGGTHGTARNKLSGGGVKERQKQAAAGTQLLDSVTIKFGQAWQIGEMGFNQRGASPLPSSLLRCQTRSSSPAQIHARSRPRSQYPSSPSPQVIATSGGYASGGNLPRHQPPQRAPSHSAPMPQPASSSFSPAPMPPRRHSDYAVPITPPAPISVGHITPSAPARWSFQPRQRQARAPSPGATAYPPSPVQSRPRNASWDPSARFRPPHHVPESSPASRPLPESHRTSYPLPRSPHVSKHVRHRRSSVSHPNARAVPSREPNSPSTPQQFGQKPAGKQVSARTSTSRVGDPRIMITVRPPQGMPNVLGEPHAQTIQRPAPILRPPVEPSAPQWNQSLGSFRGSVEVRSPLLSARSLQSNAVPSEGGVSPIHQETTLPVGRKFFASPSQDDAFSSDRSLPE